MEWYFEWDKKLYSYFGYFYRFVFFNEAIFYDNHFMVQYKDIPLLFYLYMDSLYAGWVLYFIIFRCLLVLPWVNDADLFWSHRLEQKNREEKNCLNLVYDRQWEQWRYGWYYVLLDITHETFKSENSIVTLGYMRITIIF